MKAVVVGSGSWGTGLAQVLCDNNEDVMIYGNCESEIRDINENHQNAKYFAGVELNPALKATTDIQVVKDADVIDRATTKIGSITRKNKNCKC